MAKIPEILEIEKERSDVNTWNVIHLFKEGGFYRAYEWSAWLIVSVAYSDEVRKGSTDIKPHRIYVSNQSLRRVKGNVGKIDFNDREKVFRTVNSYLGMFVHYASYNLRQQIFQHSRFTDIAPYDSNMTKMDKSKLKFNRL